MRKFFAACIVTLVALWMPATVVASGGIPGLTMPLAGLPTACAPASSFLARTSSLDSAHRANYVALICGLVSDGVWSKLDVLYVFATSSSTNALLNLASASYGGTAHGSPTFTTDRGFTGVDASSTVYIDTAFNPATAGGQYAQNAAHLSAWSNTNTGSSSGGCAVIGSDAGSGNGASQICLRHPTGTYFRVNDVNSGGGGQASIGTSNGFYVADRTSSSTAVGYLNASNQSIGAQTSTTLTSRNIYVLATDSAGSAGSGGGFQITEASMGGGLTSTDVTNLYNRLRTYMTAVGCTC